MVGHCLIDARTRRAVVALVGLCVLLLAPGAARAVVTLTPVTTATSPVYVTHARDQRLFIVEQQGRILIFDRATSSLLATPFLDIRTRVLSGGERGLLSVAFHPEYTSNGFFYVYYTSQPAGDVTIQRFHVTANPNVGDPNSASTLLTIPHPQNDHNGGQLQIGPEGHLYAALGDGGGDGDPSCFAQRGESLLGKMLRLDIRQNLAQAPFHGIPSDNPFLAATDPTNQIRDEIWALGLRNPWRFSFDRVSKDLYIADVGQNNFEEIDLHRASSPAGQNFGWKVMEGLSCFSAAACPAGTPACNSPALTLPIHTYDHTTGECSIIGGFVYRGTGAAELAGRYVFGDLCSGSIRSLRETTPGVWEVQPVVTAPGTFALTSFGEDVEGGLYAAVGNTVYKLVGTSAVPALPAAPLGALALALLVLGIVVVRRRVGARG